MLYIYIYLCAIMPSNIQGTYTYERTLTLLGGSSSLLTTYPVQSSLAPPRVLEPAFVLCTCIYV